MAAQSLGEPPLEKVGIESVTCGQQFGFFSRKLCYYVGTLLHQEDRDGDYKIVESRL